MATYNSSSATSSYPLPHAENPLNVDVARLRSALEIADAQVAARLPIASYTAADVIVKVKSLDGPGSGLDADTLDGIHAAGFAAASHTHADATTGTAGFMTAADKTKMDGIGAGANVDGQVLVLHDLLGLNPGFKPRFVRRFADGAATIQQGVADYAKAVRDGSFPGPKESFGS